jgi:hypothetical protein
MSAHTTFNRCLKLRAPVGLAAVALFIKILFAMLAEYRWYFPADFTNSAFLIGRRDSFFGPYLTAFYVHILSAPLAAALALFLILSGGRPGLRRWHRRAGRVVLFVVILLVVPSGLVMAGQAHAGPIAAAGFVALSVATGVCTVAAAYLAARKKFRMHERFARRSFILLASPLLFRLASGMAIVLGCESERFYQANAWLSWLVPLAVYEVWSRTITVVKQQPKQSLAIAKAGSYP